MHLYINLSLLKRKVYIYACINFLYEVGGWGMEGKIERIEKCKEVLNELSNEGMKTLSKVLEEAVEKQIKYKVAAVVGIDIFSCTKIILEVRGKTFQIKDELKSLNFKWDPAGAWYRLFQPEEIEELKQTINKLLEKKLIEIAYIDDESINRLKRRLKI
jgi:hypothetical protein